MFFNHTGAIYKVTNAGTALGQQNFANGQTLQAGKWNSYEMSVAGPKITGEVERSGHHDVPKR